MSISKQAIIVGFGPIGHEVAKVLEEQGIVPVIVDTNVDTIAIQKGKQREAVFGDATIHHILEAANIEAANLLIITTPEIATTMQIIESSRELNPSIRIIARTLYSADQNRLAKMDVLAICDEDQSKQAFLEAIQGLQLEFEGVNF